MVVWVLGCIHLWREAVHWGFKCQVVISPESTLLRASSLGGHNLDLINLVVTKLGGQVEESQLDTPVSLLFLAY